MRRTSNLMRGTGDGPIRRSAVSRRAGFATLSQVTELIGSLRDARAGCSMHDISLCAKHLLIPADAAPRSVDFLQCLARARFASTGTAASLAPARPGPPLFRWSLERSSGALRVVPGLRKRYSDITS